MGAFTWVSTLNGNVIAEMLGASGTGRVGNVNAAGGGGGGGAYSRSASIPVTLGTSYNGNFGVPTQVAGDHTSWFISAATWLADYGRAGLLNSSTPGGKASNGIGAVKYDGGDGASNFFADTGGGGGSAGPDGAGANGSPGSGSAGLGGASDNGGGKGGNGGNGGLSTFPSAAGPGVDGQAPGGGGGGGGFGNGSTFGPYAGGLGQEGYVIIWKASDFGVPGRVPLAIYGTPYTIPPASQKKNFSRVI